MDPVERFAALVAEDEEKIPLDESALLIAAAGRPGLDVAAELGRLDDLAAGCPAPASLEGLWGRLFEDLGFAGDDRTYRDPRNSFLDQVVARRRGIPISLSVLTIEVGRRLGVGLVGVGMPGHFLVRHQGSGELLDPFHARRGLDVAACEGLFRAVHGTEPEFSTRFLGTVGPRAVLVRILANLRAHYEAGGDARSAGWVLRMRAAVPSRTPAERVDQARAMASLGRFAEAAAVLDGLAECAGGADAEHARRQAIALRARLN